MRRLILISLSVFLISAVAATGLIAFGVGNGYFQGPFTQTDFPRVPWLKLGEHQVPFREEREIPLEDIQILELDVEYGNLKVLPGSTGPALLTVTGTVPSGDQPVISAESAGSRTLVQVGSGHPLRGSEELEITLVLPVRSLELLDISLDMGNLDISYHDAERTVAELSMGNLRLDGSFRDLSLKTHMGNTTVRGSVQSLVAECNMGNLTMHLDNFDQLEASVDLGNIDLALTETGGLRIYAAAAMGTVQVPATLSGSRQDSNGILETEAGDITVKEN